MTFSQLDAFTSYDPIALLKALYDFLINGTAPNYASGGVTFFDKLSFFFNLLPYYLLKFFTNWVVFAVLISIVLIVLIVLVSLSYVKNKNDLFKMYSLKTPKDIPAKSTEILQNPKWLQVQKHIDSENSSDWKLAILEADIMLADMLDKFSLPGESIGEKLKAVEKSDFNTLEQAWEGHKIRNAIAHEGSEFVISQREARRVIELFKQVFDEFKLI